MSTQTAERTRLQDVVSFAVLDALFDAVYVANADRRIVHWNPAAEHLIGCRAKDIVGKSCCEDLLLHIDADGKAVRSGFHPAAETLTDGQTREADVFLRHRQGHLLPVRTRTVALRDREAGIVGVMEILRQGQSAADTLDAERLRELAFIDPQTNLASRRYLEMRLLSRFEEMQRYGWKFGVVLLSVDNLAAITDEHGLPGTQAILDTIGRTFAHSLRATDAVGRWDDDHFLAIVPILRAIDLQTIGQRVRAAAGQTQATVGPLTLRATVSVGAATPSPEDSVIDILQRAQEGMHASRSRGGNAFSLL